MWFESQQVQFTHSVGTGRKEKSTYTALKNRGYSSSSFYRFFEEMVGHHYRVRDEYNLTLALSRSEAINLWLVLVALSRIQRGPTNFSAKTGKTLTEKTRAKQSSVCPVTLRGPREMDRATKKREAATLFV